MNMKNEDIVKALRCISTAGGETEDGRATG